MKKGEIGERTTSIVLALFVLLSLLHFIGCATQPNPEGFNPPGFFLALLHGLIAPFALIGSLFMDIRIYAFPNSGFFYDLGYLLGISVWAGGTSTVIQSRD